MARKFDLSRAEAYIRKTGKTESDKHFCLFANEVFEMYKQNGGDPFRTISFAYAYGFAKGKRAQAAAQRKAGVKV